MEARRARMVEIRDIQLGDVLAIPAVDGGEAWHGGEAKWRDYWDQHQRGLRVSLVASMDVGIVGYGSLVWLSQYPVFAAVGIPEVQDMVVAERFRGQRIAAAIVEAFEARARAYGRKALGIGVGLNANYGAAQRLYAHLGYVPDGRGVTFHGRLVAPGATVAVDDELALWLSKPLA